MKAARLWCAFMLSCLATTAVIIDRIAIVVGDGVIKDSDIERDIRLVDFLNRQKLSFEIQARKAAANRLIDQSLIQHEIQVGEYQIPAEADAEKLLAGTQKERAASPAAFSRLLAQYGLSVAQLRSYLYWQLTVLRFIDQRFRPAVLVSDDDIQSYYRQHLADLGKNRDGTPKTLDQTRGSIREIITNERINTAYDSWIRARRRGAQIQFHEESLR